MKKYFSIYALSTMRSLSFMEPQRPSLPYDGQTGSWVLLTVEGRLGSVASTLKLWRSKSEDHSTLLLMGGERGSTTRRRLAGKICAMCQNILPEPDRPGERLCPRCEDQRKPRRRVYVHFILSNSWYCQFLEPDLKTSAGKRLTFATPEKVRLLHERFGCDKKLEDKQALEYAIQQGRGSIWIELTEEQYRKLKGR